MDDVRIKKCRYYFRFEPLLLTFEVVFARLIVGSDRVVTKNYMSDELRFHYVFNFRNQCKIWENIKGLD